MQIRIVKIGDELYNQGKNIRKNHLFQNVDDADFYLNDPWEKKSVHVVMERENVAIGVGRLTYDEDGNGIISQMAVLPAYQNQNVGSGIMEQLIKLCVFQSAEKIYMSARETAIGFYEKLGFNTIGAKFPSPKTGIVHVSMVLKL
ncbi:MAG: hypothetical protein CMP67_03435 [Flavobacteriales bacterium]|nr:hypothetical protein [Flavobacteriales bacterium]MBO72504.1 hypothetical protein [Flavobacteriales bacterium]|tara:strand:+ start:2716 stop:3150 length:435 start_codon:yes stop_codon:yes gene_type:complete